MTYDIPVREGDVDLSKVRPKFRVKAGRLVAAIIWWKALDERTGDKTKAAAEVAGLSVNRFYELAAKWDEQVGIASVARPMLIEPIIRTKQLDQGVRDAYREAMEELGMDAKASHIIRLAVGKCTEKGLKPGSSMMGRHIIKEIAPGRPVRHQRNPRRKTVKAA